MKGSCSHTSKPTNNSNAHHENSNKKKVYDPCKHCGKTNHPEKNCFKLNRLLSKAKKKGFDESHIDLCASVVCSTNSSSNVEWIMDSGASKHMTGNASLFTSYDNNKHIS